MANRDFNKIKRIMQDFSMGVGEGGSSGGDSELIFGYEIADLDGKHVSVDKLIALLQKYNVPGTGYNYLNIGSNTNSYSAPYAIMDIGDQSGLAFELINTEWGYVGVTSSEQDFYTILQENKTDIEENLIIGKDYTAGGVSPYVGVAYVYLPLIVAYNSNGSQVHFKVTKQEILDLFVD